MGNLIPDAVGRMRITTKGLSADGEPLGTLQEFGVWSEGCFGEMTNGKAVLKGCTARRLPSSGDSYPYSLTIVVSYCLGSGCENYQASSEYPAVFRAPVQYMAFYLCVPDVICQKYYYEYEDQWECGCTASILGDRTSIGVKLFPRTVTTEQQVANEPYFYKPQIRLMDSNGELCHYSKLSIDVYMSPTTTNGRGCASQFGDNGVKIVGKYEQGEKTTITAAGGIATFNGIGTHVNNCAVNFQVEFVFETSHYGRLESMSSSVWSGDIR